MKAVTTAATGVLLGAAGLLACSQAQAQTAQAIMAKMATIYKGAKSYQGIYQMNMNAGPQGAMTMNMDVKTLQGSKTAVRVTGTGQAAMFTMQMVDDGKNIYTYMPMMNGYTKQPHTAASAASSRSMVISPEMFKDGTYKLLAPTAINGVPVFTVQATGKTGNPATIYVGKSDYHLKQIKSMGPNGVPVMVTVKSEKFNAPVSTSAFTFTPPPGAKLMQGGGMMGGMGGGMRR